MIYELETPDDSVVVRKREPWHYWQGIVVLMATLGTAVFFSHGAVTYLSQGKTLLAVFAIVLAMLGGLVFFVILFHRQKTRFDWSEHTIVKKESPRLWADPESMEDRRDLEDDGLGVELRPSANRRQYLVLMTFAEQPSLEIARLASAEAARELAGQLRAALERRQRATGRNTSLSIDETNNDDNTSS